MILPPISEDFEWTLRGSKPALMCPALAAVAPHFFTTSDWTLGSRAGDDEAGWEEIVRAAGVDALVRVHQVHGAAVFVHRAGSRVGRDAPTDADLIVSDDPAAAIAIQTADCVPLLLADRRSGAVAAAHAGWRGLAAGVPGVAVVAMVDAFGARPEDLVAAVGPSISAARYEVDVTVRVRFEERFHVGDIERWFSAGRPGRWSFDGWQSARDQLATAGLMAGNIHVARLCTATHEMLCSYRRDGKGAGRIAATIWKDRG